MHSSPPRNRLFLACLWQLVATELQTCSTSLWSALRLLHCTIQHCCFSIQSSVTFVLSRLRVHAAALAASATFDKEIDDHRQRMNAHRTGVTSAQALVVCSHDLGLEYLATTTDAVACFHATLQCQITSHRQCPEVAALNKTAQTLKAIFLMLSLLWPAACQLQQFLHLCR